MSFVVVVKQVVFTQFETYHAQHVVVEIPAHRHAFYQLGIVLRLGTGEGVEVA